MADEDEDEKKRLAAEAAGDDESESPDDIIAGPDAPPVEGDPQIMTMTGGAPPPSGAYDPRVRNAAMGGMHARGGMGHGGGGFPMGGMGGGMLHGLMERINAARQQRFQQFAGTPMGQQFMQSPMGQRMGERHPDWMPQPAQDPAAAAAPPGGAAQPPTAAAAADQQAQQAQPAAAKPEYEETTTKTRRPFRGDSQQQQQQPPAGVQQRPAQRGPMPMFGGNASSAIQNELQKRLGGGGGQLGGRGRMF